MGSAVIELNPNYPGTKQKKYNVYPTDVIDMQPVGKGQKLFDSDKTKDIARWVKEADKVVMVDGCFLQCIGRLLNNLVDEEKIVHIDALRLYKKYTDIFYMEDVPEAERIDTARQVADQILPSLRNI